MQSELMSNEVDVSDNTLSNHTNNIKKEFLENDKSKEDLTEPTLNVGESAGALVGEQCIKMTLAMFDIAVDDVLIKDTAKNYSLLFQKYFPNVEMLDKWKEEIACVVSTFALGGAIMIQVKQKKAQKIEQETIEEQSV